jgi:hypothetical protein
MLLRCSTSPRLACVRKGASSVRLLCDDTIRVLLRALVGTLPKSFTGKVTITLNYHAGTAATCAVGFEEGQKLTA